MQELELIKQLIKKENFRITKARLAVAEILIKAQDQFQSSEEIFIKIQASKQLECDQVSVYRTLTTFESLGIVTKSNFQGEAARFQLTIKSAQATQSIHNDHQHFFKCIDCSKIEPFQDCVIVQKEKELIAKGYKSLKHHLEIIGVCPSCATI
jgi:Fur family transcriptional regulator, ferric uptake regulator